MHMSAFKLGDQPEWAGEEDCLDLGANFVSDLLEEDSEVSLINRGYALVHLDESAQSLYSDFHIAFEEFSALPKSEKGKFASLQFEPSQHSPNQLHGYSEIKGLKEQFMMRLCGEGSDLIFPNTGAGGIDFGIAGVQLLENMDLACRKIARRCLTFLGENPDDVDDILDPVSKIGFPAKRNGRTCTSNYVPKNYISSSIMDNFHYSAHSHEKTNQFRNNHSSHTDSGLLTMVIITDVPGLEVYDSVLERWVAIEQLVHESLALADGEKPHRKFAVLFWGDSVVYLRAPKLRPCLHRVANCKDERFSIVYKQRTAPLRTACRYQEDYILSQFQQASMASLNFRPMLCAAFAWFSIVAIKGSSN